MARSTKAKTKKTKDVRKPNHRTTKKTHNAGMPTRTKQSNQDANWWQVRVTINGLKTFIYHLTHSPNTHQKLINETKDVQSWFKGAVMDPESDTPLENMFQTANRKIKACVQEHAMQCGCVECFTLFTKNLQQINV